MASFATRLIRLSFISLLSLEVSLAQGEDSFTHSEFAFNQAVFSIHGGLSIPVYSFASTKGQQAGFAETGFVAGVDTRVPIGRSLFWLIATTFTYNPIDEYGFRNSNFIGSTVVLRFGGWWAITPMAGVGLTFPFSDESAFIASARAGIFLAGSPSIETESGGTSARQSSSTATTFGYCFSVGVLKLSNIHLSLQYQFGKPKFTAKASNAPSSFTFEQSMSVLQVVVATGL